MNHYPHHIGDFRSGTVNMTRLERWIYRDLIDFYYDKERALPADVDLVCREIGARSDDERAVVIDLLKYKFVLTEKGYEHERCETVIAEYRAKADVAKENGKLGGRPKKAAGNPEKPSGFPFGSDPVRTANPELTGSQANQEPLTNNQEPNKTFGTADVGGEPRANARPSDLSAAMRRNSIEAQPGDPRIVAAAEAGITVETIEAACVEAKSSDTTGRIKAGFVVAIAQRWTADAAHSPPNGRPQKARSYHDDRKDTIEGLTGRNQRHEHDTRIIDIEPVARLAR